MKFSDICVTTIELYLDIETDPSMSAIDFYNIWVQKNHIRDISTEEAMKALEYIKGFLSMDKNSLKKLIRG